MPGRLRRLAGHPAGRRQDQSARSGQPQAGRHRAGATARRPRDPRPSVPAHQATIRSCPYGVQSRSDWTSAPGSGASVSGLDAFDEERDQPFLELRPGGVLEAAKRFRHAHRLAIRTGRRHRREGISDRQDAGDQRDLLAGQAIEVPVAVPSLVVMADAVPDDVDVGQVADDQVAERDVLLDDRASRRRSASRACAGCGPGRRSCRRRGAGRRPGSSR